MVIDLGGLFDYPVSKYTSLIRDFLVALLATFLGVFLAFWLDRRNDRKRERETYRKMLQAVLLESSQSHTVLKAFRDRSTLEALPAMQIGLDACQAALLSPLFWQHSGFSTLMLLGAVRTDLSITQEFFRHFRELLFRIGKLNEGQLEQIRRRAKGSLGFIGILQKHLDKIMLVTGAQIRADVEWNEIGKELLAVPENLRKGLYDDV